MSKIVWTVCILVILGTITFATVDIMGWDVANPKSGEVWVAKDLYGRNDNPFRRVPMETVVVIDTREGWVQVVYSDTPTSKSEYRFHTFKHLYRRLGD